MIAATSESQQTVADSNIEYLIAADNSRCQEKVEDNAT